MKVRTKMRTITVKGIGSASSKPDCVVLSMTLESLDKDYGKAVDASAAQLEKLRGSLTAAGFGEDALKTVNFNIRTEYEHVSDKNGNYRPVFKGYAVCHSLKIEFDFDQTRLSDALYAVSSCLAEPQLNISFTLKDPTAINDEMLRSATENARRKAEILCESAGTKLGQLVSINYSWDELAICSETDMCMGTNTMAMAKSIAITPDDIRVSDSATFVWEIL